MDYVTVVGSAASSSTTLRPVSASFGSTSTLGGARFSPYPTPSSVGSSSPATAITSVRTPSSGGRSTVGKLDYSTTLLKPRHAREWSGSGLTPIKPTSAPAYLDFERSTSGVLAAAAAAAAANEALIVQASKSLPVPSSSRRAGLSPPADYFLPGGATYGLLSPPEVPEHYPLETLALLFTVGVQATWASTSPQALRAALTADKKQAALAMHTEDSPTARLLRFYQWCHHMLSRTRLPAFAVLSGLVYLHRLCKSPSHSNSSGLPVDPGSDYRVASIAAILANKYLDDNRFTNKTWSTVTGFPVPELTRMEVEFAHSIAWNLAISDEEWNDYIELQVVSSGLWNLVVDVLGNTHAYLRKTLSGATAILTTISRKLPQDVDEPGVPKKQRIPTAPKQQIPNARGLPLPQSNVPAPTTEDRNKVQQLLAVMGQRRLPGAAAQSLGSHPSSRDALDALAIVQARHRQDALLQTVRSGSGRLVPGERISPPPLPQTFTGEEDAALGELADKIQRAARLDSASPAEVGKDPMSIGFLLGGDGKMLPHGLLPLRRESLSDEQCMAEELTAGA